MRFLKNPRQGRGIALAAIVILSCILAEITGNLSMGAYRTPRGLYSARTTTSMTSGNPHQIGLALKADIERTYDRLVDEGAVQKGDDGIDITSIVAAYIPVGSSFDTAENILKEAGFHVGSRPGPNRNSFGDYSVIASLSPFRTSLVSKVDVYIFLYPQSPTDYNEIAKVDAAIMVSIL